MEPNHMNPGESIKTIEAMLKQAKAEKTGASFYYILWGTLLFIHYLLLFITVQFPAAQGGLMKTIIWGVFPLGGLLSYFRSKKDGRKETALSHYERIYLFAFGGFALAYGTMFIASVFAQPRFPIVAYPLLLGLTVFVVGGITKQKGAIIGGISGIICAGISLNMPLEIQYLLAALCSLLSCAIPGFLMKNSNV